MRVRPQSQTDLSHLPLHFEPSPAARIFQKGYSRPQFRRVLTAAERFADLFTGRFYVIGKSRSRTLLKFEIDGIALRSLCVAFSAAGER